MHEARPPRPISFATAAPSSSSTSASTTRAPSRGEQPRRRLAGAARGARHDRDLALDPSHSALGLAAALRRWRTQAHPGLQLRAGAVS